MSSRRSKHRKMAAHFGWRLRITGGWLGAPDLSLWISALDASTRALANLSDFRQRAAVRDGNEITFTWINESREPA